MVLLGACHARGTQSSAALPDAKLALPGFLLDGEGAVGRTVPVPIQLTPPFPFQPLFRRKTNGKSIWKNLTAKTVLFEARFLSDLCETYTSCTKKGISRSSE
jgi:hypothetical protein